MMIDILLYLDVGFIIYLIINYKILSVSDNFILVVAIIFSFIDIESTELIDIKILILAMLIYETIKVYRKKSAITR